MEAGNEDRFGAPQSGASGTLPPDANRKRELQGTTTDKENRGGVLNWANRF